MTYDGESQEYFEQVRTQLAGRTLPPLFAKLYSQYTRLTMNQPGLRYWRPSEFSERLADAVTLIDAGLGEREIRGTHWRDSLRRAGEVLEWLSQPQLNEDGLPLRLLAAGSYQLAGYPALSTGLLFNDPKGSPVSPILISLLKADFPSLLSLTTSYWISGSDQPESLQNGSDVSVSTSSIGSRVVTEVVKALGILTGYMRWGDDDRLQRSQQKLQHLSGVMLHGRDTYSWLLSKIASEVVDTFVGSSLRAQVKRLQDRSPEEGRQAFERYLRINYQAGKSLTWPSQVQGIENLLDDKSFVLCTPTGSGKTTIAELAIIQSLSESPSTSRVGTDNSLVIYLVPSRALASEVEFKMERILGRLGKHAVKVTGLYGGIDWGPTDAWLTSTEPTLLICTYEKAEALIRFLGPLFLNRVSLIVVDEAHSVQFHSTTFEALRTGDDRSLRLEMLANRLLRYVGDKRVIALSAVAEETDSLARWISDDQTSTATVSNYRSTRQLIGRLEWTRTGNYAIHYDVLNQGRLQFDRSEYRDEVPYVRDPFAPFPLPYDDIPRKFTNPTNRVGKRQRPYVFWAAMQLAQPDEEGRQHGVLISITQGINGYAADFLTVLNNTLHHQELPNFFTPPTDDDLKELFEDSLAVCQDYFGRDSNEYRLLERGIAVHHGKMPGLLSRKIVALIERRVIHVILATSTLSEGVNLPVETVIVPTLNRRGRPIPLSEFKNLAGRAGRPGWSTEGRTLVILENSRLGSDVQRERQAYNTLLGSMVSDRQMVEGSSSLSPLGALLQDIRQQWHILTNGSAEEQFTDWLEKTVPLSSSVNREVSAQEPISSKDAEESLDSLDGFLLSIIVEQEIIDRPLNRAELEDYLIKVWQRTYAHHVIRETDGWQKLFAIRGGAVQERIYPDPSTRRKLYRTTVAPRFGKPIIESYRTIQAHLMTGHEYASWSIDERIQYITETVRQIGALKKFQLEDTIGRASNPPHWQDVLQWWLNPQKALRKPKPTGASEWINFVKTNFEYRFNWGLGSILGLILDDVNDGQITPTSIKDWPRTGLPWIVFWLKELITWGTTDPVAAWILAHRLDSVLTRDEAEHKAQAYYATVPTLPSEDVLDPRSISQWSADRERALSTLEAISSDRVLQNVFTVTLRRDFSKAQIRNWRVLPVHDKTSIRWLDPAGYELARSDEDASVSTNMMATHDFYLNPKSKTVEAVRFLL